MRTKLLILGVTAFFSYSIYGYGTEREPTVDNQTIRSIVLHNGWLYFVSLNGEELARERISEIRSIVLSCNSTENNDIIDIPEESIRIYPNPMQETLYIESAQTETYKVFDLDGRCLLSGEGNTINVSSLNTGTYLLQINNNTFKFIKQ